MAWVGKDSWGTGFLLLNMGEGVMQTINKASGHLLLPSTPFLSEGLIPPKHASAPNSISASASGEPSL